MEDIVTEKVEVEGCWIVWCEELVEYQEEWMGMRDVALNWRGNKRFIYSTGGSHEATRWLPHCCFATYYRVDCASRLESCHARDET